MCLKIKMSIKQDILNVDISYWGWKLCERVSATSIIMHHTDAIFLPLTRAWGGEGYNEVVLRAKILIASVLWMNQKMVL